MDLVQCMTDCVSVFSPPFSFSISPCLFLLCPLFFFLIFFFWINATVPLHKVRPVLTEKHSHTLSLWRCFHCGLNGNINLLVIWQKKTLPCSWNFASHWPESPYTHQHNTVVFPADVDLNPVWNHVGPLCHNQTRNHSAGLGVGGFGGWGRSRGSVHMFM